MIKKIYINKNCALAGANKNIIYDGLILNSNVLITDNIDICDYIFILSNDDIKTIDKNILKKKYIVIDYSDNSRNISKIDCYKYFKRSVVNQNTKMIINNNTIPISFCLRNETLNFKNLFNYKRNIDISIFFNTYNANDHNFYRNKIAKFIKNNFSDYNIHVGIIGKNDKIGRTTIQKEYFSKTFESKIIVTCNPKDWEGDYRTWEALSSGALVMVDRMLTPIINPLIDNEHIIYYDRDNLDSLKQKLFFYLKDNNLREKIAKNGNDFVLKYHKTSNRIDEILSHLK